MPLVSVIVPVYNTEKYLHRCIDSILSQTFSDFELLLIDDGSTDQSGTICDEYARKDSRVKVFHKENGGVSSARNLGLDNTRGEWVTFCDSDDFIHKDMCRTLMNNIQEDEDADIIVCGVADYVNDEVIHRQESSIIQEVEIYSHREAVLKLLEDDEWKSYTMNKIYRSSLFQAIDFPVGRNLDEDFSVMHQVFHKSKRVLFNRSKFCYYRHREGSNCHSYDVDSMTKKATDRIVARWERLQFVESHQEYLSMLNRQKNDYLAVALAVMRIASKYPQKFPPSFFRQNHNNIKSVKDITFESKYFNFRKILELFVLKYSPECFKVVYSVIPAWK